MEPHYKGICPACRYSEAMSELSLDEIYARTRAITEKRERDKRRANLLLWILFPYFQVFAWFFKSSLKNASTSSSPSVSGSGGTSFGGDSSSAAKSSSFAYYGGDGNLHQSSDSTFVDFAGNVLQWGCPFVDGKGNTVGFGEPFYDGRGNYVTWGSPFYDAKGHYINPKG